MDWVNQLGTMTQISLIRISRATAKWRNTITQPTAMETKSLPTRRKFNNKNTTIVTTTTRTRFVARFLTIPQLVRKSHHSGFVAEMKSSVPNIVARLPVTVTLLKPTLWMNSTRRPLAWSLVTSNPSRHWTARNISLNNGLEGRPQSQICSLLPGFKTRKTSANVRTLLSRVRWWKNNVEKMRSNWSSGYGKSYDNPSSNWISRTARAALTFASLIMVGSPSSPETGALLDAN